MSNIEKIRQEIERLKKIFEESTYYLDNSQQALGYSFALDDFKEFIDSLPDERLTWQDIKAIVNIADAMLDDPKMRIAIQNHSEEEYYRKVLDEYNRLHQTTKK